MTRQQLPENYLDNLLGGGPSIRAQLKYDYDLIPADQREAVQSAAVAIIKAGRQAQESLIDIGQKLIAAKEMLDHGQFSDWCETEFAFSQRTAQNMMSVAAQFGGKSETVSFLSDSALYLLAAPSTPEAAREEVIAEAQATGQSPTKAQVQAVIAAHKAPTKAQRAAELTPHVLAYARTWRNAQGQTIYEYNPYSASHSNGQFWPAIKKHLQAAGIAYDDDSLKLAVRAATEQAQAERQADPPALTVPEDWQVQAMIERMYRDEQYNLWPSDEPWLIGQIVSIGQRRGWAISEQFAAAQLDVTRRQIAAEDQREQRLVAASAAAEQADRERQARPHTLPADLAARGWELRQVPGSGRWYANNKSGPRATGIYDNPEDAVAAAYDMQRDLRRPPVVEVEPPPEPSKRPDLQHVNAADAALFSAIRQLQVAADYVAGWDANWCAVLDAVIGDVEGLRKDLAL